MYGCCRCPVEFDAHQQNAHETACCRAVQSQSQALLDLCSPSLCMESYYTVRRVQQRAYSNIAERLSRSWRTSDTSEAKIVGICLICHDFFGCLVSMSHQNPSVCSLHLSPASMCSAQVVRPHTVSDSGARRLSNCEFKSSLQKGSHTCLRQDMLRNQFTCTNSVVHYRQYCRNRTCLEGCSHSLATSNRGPTTV